MADPRVGIEIEAEDNTEDAFDEAGDRIDELGDRANKAGSIGFKELEKGANAASNAIQRGYSAMTRLDLTAISLQQSTERVGNAQLRYNDAVERFGPASSQAMAAHQELENAQSALEKTQLRARLSYVMVTADIITMAAQAPRLAAGLVSVGASARAAAAGMTAFQLASVSVLGVIGAVGVALGGLAVFKEYEDRTSRGATATDELAMAQERLDKTQQRVNRNFEWFGQAGGLALNVIADQMGKALPGLRSPLEDVAEAQERLNDAQAAVDLEDAVRQEQADAKAKMEQAAAAQALEEANQSLATATRNAYAGIGVDLGRFSQDFQESLLRAAGVQDEFIGKMRPLVTAEQLLAGASGETRAALLEQLEVTARKGETTEDLAKRLGLTADEEARLRAEGRFTTEGIVAQGQAAQYAANAILTLADAQAKATTTMAGPNGLPEVNREAQMMFASGAGWVNAFASQTVLRGPGNEAYGNAFQFGQQKPQGLVPAAMGFDGMVSKPTMFLAGEAGPEHVQVTPGGRGGGGMGDLNVHVHLAPGEGTQQGVERAAVRAMGRGVRMIERRWASRRSF